MSVPLSLAAPASASEWPMGLLLDEVWLRSRRVVVHELEREELWPERERYRETVRRLTATGSELRASLLRAILPEDDFTALAGEAIFGPANRRFRTRLPLVLAFGYEIGYCLHRLGRGQAPEAHRIGEICSLFNTGVSVFDLVHDSSTLAGRFAEVFDDSLLDQLVERPRVHAEGLTHRLENQADIELRFLIAIIARFFSLVGESHWTSGRQQSLAPLLRRAYEAELESARSGQRAEPWIAKEKSTLPFEIIGRLAAPASGARNEEIEALARDLGIVFWRLDDLVDAVTDIQMGAVNSLVPPRDGNSEGDYHAAAAIVAGTSCEDVAHEVVSGVQRCLDSYSAPTNADRERFRADLLAYVRNWLE